MKTIRDLVTNYRYWVLTLLTAIAVICLLSEPTAITFLGWITTLVISKAMGVAVVIIAIRLFRYWGERGEITCLTKFIGEN